MTASSGFWQDIFEEGKDLSGFLSLVNVLNDLVITDFKKIYKISTKIKKIA